MNSVLEKPTAAAPQVPVMLTDKDFMRMAVLFVTESHLTLDELIAEMTDQSPETCHPVDYACLAMVHRSNCDPVINQIHAILTAREQSIATMQGQQWRPQWAMDTIRQNPGAAKLTLDHWKYLGQGLGYGDDWAKVQLGLYGSSDELITYGQKPDGMQPDGRIG